MTVAQRETLIGNRWVLTGGVIYLLEWVAIIWVGAAGVGEQALRGATGADVMDTYAGHEDAVYAMAGWFAVVLLGRILLFIGLRHAMVDSGHGHPLMDLAVAASAVSVTLEIASYGLAASAVEQADAGQESLTLAIDQAGAGLNLMIGGGLGVAIVCATYVMWRSGLFPLPLTIVGGLSGVAIIGAQLTVAPSLQTVYDILFVFPVLFWVWMLWAGVLCWRSTGHARPAGEDGAGVAVR